MQNRFLRFEQEVYKEQGLVFSLFIYIFNTFIQIFWNCIVHVSEMIIKLYSVYNCLQLVADFGSNLL